MAALGLVAAAAGDEGDYKVRFETITPAGSFVLQIHSDWAPLGAARFRELVEDRFFDGASFFRVIPRFMAQFGIAANP